MVLGLTFFSTNYWYAEKCATAGAAGAPRSMRPQSSRAAVVLRGEHTQRDGTSWGPLDWRRSFESLSASYIRPRRADGWLVHLFYHTHHSNESAALHAVLRPRACAETKTTSSTTSCIEVNASHQFESGGIALNLVPKSATYDEYLFTRFDVLYKLPFAYWNVSSSTDGPTSPEDDWCPSATDALV